MEHCLGPAGAAVFDFLRQWVPPAPLTIPPARQRNGLNVFTGGPQIAGLSPVSTYEGEKLRLKGHEFAAGDRILIGETVTQTSQASRTNLTAMVPASTGSRQTVRVLTPFGDTSNAVDVHIRVCGDPEWDPDTWNDRSRVRWQNNCYNYACDIRTDTYAQPGKGSGHLPPEFDVYREWGVWFYCPVVEAAAVADGVKAIDPGGVCCHKIALVLADDWDFDPFFNDYHWYRLDANGLWSHKIGSLPATNRDNSGKLITDPRTADRGFYKTFCGYYWVCRGQVKIA